VISSAVLTAQVTLLLLLALALAWLGRRGSPRTIHQLWTATFALVLVLPLLSLFGPSWEVPLLPARGGDRGGESAPAVVDAAASRTLDPTLDAPGSMPTLETGEAREALVPAARPGRAARDGLAGRAGLPGRADAAGSAANAATGRSAVRTAWIAWLAGCALSLVSLAFAALRLRKLVRTARPVRDPGWVREAEKLRRRLGLRGEVRLLSGEAVATPMTGGLWKPVILLPAAAAKWSPERRAVVLTHELIHIRRRDVLRQLVRRTVLALYWFHPLGWLAARRAEIASEKACDEEVLALGASLRLRPPPSAARVRPRPSSERTRAPPRKNLATGDKNRGHSEPQPPASQRDPDCRDLDDRRLGGGLCRCRPSRPVRRSPGAVSRSRVRPGERAFKRNRRPFGRNPGTARASTRGFRPGGAPGRGVDGHARSSGGAGVPRPARPAGDPVPVGRQRFDTHDAGSRGPAGHQLEPRRPHDREIG